jgi:predicted transcriptional regulator
MKWHRIFGLALTDFFTGTAYRVELEKDLSLKRQFLDVVIIEQESGEQLTEVPDGLDNLGKHNLLTYKSMRQALDDWTLDELVGHYVNYRKQISPAVKKLLPVEDFRLYAVSTRFPRKLSELTPFRFVQTGVFETKWGSHDIRIIVLSWIPQEKRNALWELFSAIPEKVRFGASEYQWRRQTISTIINDLYEKYETEGLIMPYTVEDYYKDFTKRHLDWLTTEDRLKGLTIDEILKRFSKEDLLKRFSKEDLLKRFSKEDLLKRFSPEEIEEYLEKLRQNKN